MEDPLIIWKRGDEKREAQYWLNHARPSFNTPGKGYCEAYTRNTGSASYFCHRKKDHKGPHVSSSFTITNSTGPNVVANINLVWADNELQAAILKARAKNGK